MQYTVIQVQISKNDLKAHYKAKGFTSQICEAENLSNDYDCVVEKVLLKILVEREYVKISDRMIR